MKLLPYQIRQIKALRANVRKYRTAGDYQVANVYRAQLRVMFAAIRAI